LRYRLGLHAVVEYIGGRQMIHHGRQHQEMTNSPIFDEQLALNEW
jgi:penicillin V acylase-like amidase (Ntn superfamily)